MLNVTKPDIALISVGKGNKFKHPNQETLDILKKYKVRIYRTDLLGNIKIDLKRKRTTFDKK